MQPLTVDDLLPLEEYVGKRGEFFASHRRYVDRYRRVRIGPRLTLIFENRQTLWFRVQEILRVARLSEPNEVQQELNLYNRLLPSRNLLQAALLIDAGDNARFAKEMADWRNIQGEHLSLVVGDEWFPAVLVTCRPEDRSIGTSHWLQFHLDPAARARLGDFEKPAFFRFVNDHYQHESAPLSEELRHSLVDDLQRSENDPRKTA
jgi:hypothetical protein